MPLRTVRRPAALGLAVAALLSLAGCEKPTPTVTVNSGSSTGHSDALCWNRDNATVAENDCRATGDVPTIEVSPGQTIGISVDPAIAATGWIPAIGTQSLVGAPLTSTYYRFALNEQNLQQPLELRVYAVVKGQQPQQQRGLWVFRLQRK
ncbi:MAG: hypothetical protein ACTHOD_06250 [Motilibacteraceae bacterium]